MVFISGYGRHETIAQTQKAGAADHLVNPFSRTELTARVGAALRRVDLGELATHYEKRPVTVVGRPIELTTSELLVRNLDKKLHANLGDDAQSRPGYSACAA